MSFAAVIVSITKMDPAALHRGEPVERAKGQLREGLRYVWNTPILRTSLLMMAIIGTISFNFRILLPVMAEREFGGGAGTFGLLYRADGRGDRPGCTVRCQSQSADTQDPHLLGHCVRRADCDRGSRSNPDRLR